MYYSKNYGIYGEIDLTLDNYIEERLLIEPITIEKICKCGATFSVCDTNPRDMCWERCGAKPKCTKCDTHLNYPDYESGTGVCKKCIKICDSPKLL